MEVPRVLPFFYLSFAVSFMESVVVPSSSDVEGNGAYA